MGVSCILIVLRPVNGLKELYEYSLKTSLYITLGEFINLQYNEMVIVLDIPIFKERAKINQLKSQISCFYLRIHYLAFSDNFRFFNRFL